MVPGFDDTLRSTLVSRKECPLIHAKRDEAFSAYSKIPAPTGRDEEWRRTDPELFAFADMTPAAYRDAGEALHAGPWDEDFDVVVSIDDKHITIRDITGVLRSGQIRVCSLDEAARRYPDQVEKYLSGAALPPDADKFAALNAAFWNVGLYIEIPEKTVLERGVLLRTRLEEAARVTVPRLVVVAGAGSRGSVVEHLESADGSSLLAVASRELYVGEAAKLTFLTLQEWGDETQYISSDMAHLERDGAVSWYVLHFGGKVCKCQFGSDVDGEGTTADLDGVFFASGDQHFDQRTLQVHSSRNSYSRLLYKGAVKDRGRSVYQGIIRAKPGAVLVDSYQTNNNLVLNNGARVDSIPGLLIDADDLKCSHGATIGNLDPEQLFYLRSRGIDADEARKIVIHGFFDEIVTRIPFPAVQERVHAQIERKTGW